MIALLIALFILGLGNITLTFMLIGRVNNRAPLAPATPEPPKPICGCSHHLAYHDSKLGECNQKIKHGMQYTGATMTKWKMIPCPCKQYSGPKPLDEFFATPTYLES